MDNEKPWYLSKTIWASIVSVTATIASFFGIPMDEIARQGITDGALQIVSTIAGLIAIFGRVTAASKII